MRRAFEPTQDAQLTPSLTDATAAERSRRRPALRSALPYLTTRNAPRMNGWIRQKYV